MFCFFLMLSFLHVLPTESVLIQKGMYVRNALLKRFAQSLLAFEQDPHPVSYKEAEIDSIRRRLAEKFSLQELIIMNTAHSSKMVWNTIWGEHMHAYGWKWMRVPMRDNEAYVTYLERSTNEVPKGKEFAEKVAEELQKLGLQTKETWEVIRACSPRNVRASLWYAEALIATGYDPDVIWAVFGGLNGSDEYRGMGIDRALAVLKNLKIPISFENNGSRGFFRILKGTRLLVRFLSRNLIEQ